MASDDAGDDSGGDGESHPYTNGGGAGASERATDGGTEGSAAGDGDEDSGGESSTSGGGTAGESEPTSEGDAPSFDPGLLRQFADDLSRVDIQVLSAIRDINERPEDYEAEVTAGGQMPANTTSIRTTTELSKRQVEYRLTPGGRGLDEWGPNGLLLCYEPELTQTGGMGPRSAELTALGQRVLAVAKGEEDVGQVVPRGGAAISTEEFEALQESVEALTEQMEEIAPLVEQWADREWGAVNQDEAGKVGGMFKTVIQLIQTFQALGLDREVYADDDALGRETQAALRERMVETMMETAAEEGLLAQPDGQEAAAPGDVGGGAGSAESDGGSGSGSGSGAAADTEAGEVDAPPESEPATGDVLEPDAENEPPEAAGGDGEATGLDEFSDEGGERR
jgi:hypothetical protein